jgi:hypothetical protein
VDPQFHTIPEYFEPGLTRPAGPARAKPAHELYWAGVDRDLEARENFYGPSPARKLRSDMSSEMVMGRIFSARKNRNFFRPGPINAQVYSTPSLSESRSDTSQDEDEGAERWTSGEIYHASVFVAHRTPPAPAGEAGHVWLEDVLFYVHEILFAWSTK